MFYLFANIELKQIALLLAKKVVHFKQRNFKGVSQLDRLYTITYVVCKSENIFIFTLINVVHPPRQKKCP